MYFTRTYFSVLSGATALSSSLAEVYKCFSTRASGLTGGAGVVLCVIFVVYPLWLFRLRFFLEEGPFLPLFFAIPSVGVVFCVYFFRTGYPGTVLVVVLGLVVPGLGRIETVVRVFARGAASVVPFGRAVFSFTIVAFNRRRTVPAVSNGFTVFSLW